MFHGRNYAARSNCATVVCATRRGQLAQLQAPVRPHSVRGMEAVDAAREANMSAFYFCKVFKRATGLTFTDYVARVRIESVRHLLLNPHTRVSEAAYAAGFQSLSQFNRTFRRIAGEAPSAYRDRLHGGAVVGHLAPLPHAA